MAETVAQTYQNHRRFVPLFHFVATTLLLVNLVGALYLLFQKVSVGAVVGVLVAIALAIMLWYMRIFALTVQDRVIRLEERLRLARLLPADLQGRIDELSVGQLCGLRFASDEEVADLVRQVLADNIRSREEIKKRIRSWRADHLRA